MHRFKRLFYRIRVTFTRPYQVGPTPNHCARTMTVEEHFSQLREFLEPTMNVHMTFIFYGSAADHRGAWEPSTLYEDFELECGETLTPSGLPNGVLLHGTKKKMPVFVSSLIRHVRQKVAEGLCGYPARIYTHLSQDPLHPQEHFFILEIRSFYGLLEQYKFMIHAPSSVQRHVTNCDFIFDTLMSMDHWEVNSISQFHRIRCGIMFSSREDDAVSVARLFHLIISDEIILRTPDCCDVPFRQYRRGNMFHLQFGITTSMGTVWGPAPKCLPIKKGYANMRQIDDDCAICLTELRKDVVVTDCHHVFHMKCMQALWEHGGQAFKCPMCRAGVDALQRVRFQPTESISQRVVKRRRKK